MEKAVKLEPQNAYYLSQKGSIETLMFYVALQEGSENAREGLKTIENTYLSVFKMDSSYLEDKLTLVEFFGGLPEEEGGDSEKAEKYAMELALISRHSVDEQASSEFMDRANALDPFFSRAFAVPEGSLFLAPDEVIHEYGYYLSPF
nr:hypothetical protein [Bacteroidota bacterium]